MGDSATMTIDFLRARLLSERSVSRTAKQRAAQLAKRVMELEEQLRLVTLQRKKAEKAAAEVLSILETRRIGDLSEAVDWDSERDIPSRKGSDSNLKENESSTASRTERSEVEDALSGSEPEVLPSQGKSLSWKTHDDSPDSYDKQRAKDIRRRHRQSSFMLTSQSSLKHSGKSCRKIVRREMGSATESETHIPSLLDSHGNGGVEWPNNNCDDYSENSKDASRAEVEETLEDASASHFVDDQCKEAESGPYTHDDGRDNEMERVLEQQAQFIGQFQAEEKAQREWEEKYNEKRMSTQTHCELETPYPLAENSSQFKEEAPEAAGRSAHNDEEPKPRTGNIEPMTSSENISEHKESFDGALSNGFRPTNQISGSSSKVQKNETESSYEEFAFPGQELSDMMTNRKEYQRLLDDYSNIGSQSSSRFRSHGHVIHENSVSTSQRNPRSCSDGQGILENSESSPRSNPRHSNGHGILENSKSGSHNNPRYSNGHDILENSLSGSHNNPRLCSNSNGILEDSVGNGFSINNGRQLQRYEHPEIQKRNHGQLAVVPISSLGGVLESLQRAKLSLKQELRKLPSRSDGTMAIAASTSSHARTFSHGDHLDIPTGSDRLFRLPFDSFPQAQFSRPKFYTSEFNSTAGYPGVGYAGSSYGFQNPTSTPIVEPRSRDVLGKAYFDPQLSVRMGLPSSSRYSSTYPNLSEERMPSHSELMKSYSDIRNGLPPGDLYSSYGGDRTRSDMRTL